jgi:hypothetical protein
MSVGGAKVQEKRLWIGDANKLWGGRPQESDGFTFSFDTPLPPHFPKSLESSS